LRTELLLSRPAGAADISAALRRYESGSQSHNRYGHAHPNQ
jgi:hypothetical protein